MPSNSLKPADMSRFPLICPESPLIYCNSPLNRSAVSAQCILFRKRQAKVANWGLRAGFRMRRN